MKATEERFDQDQKLAGTRFGMKVLGLKTTYQTAIETVQANFAERQHRFMVSVSQCFKEFVDFTAPISEDSAHETVDQVLNASGTASKRSRKARMWWKSLQRSERSLGTTLVFRCHPGPEKHFPLLNVV
jgi:hypothetical protein